MGAKEMVEALGFAEQLGYPSGSTIFEGGLDNNLYCYLDSQKNIGFPKLEVVLSTMPFKDFSKYLAYTHLKV
jgi:hypothetical protein